MNFSPQTGLNNSNQFQNFSPNQYMSQIQQLFPTPQGNVYFINNSLEVANIPMGNGFSVALCLPEKLLYLKTIQNGNPMFLVYSLEPYNVDNNNNNNNNNETQLNIEDFLKKIDERLNNVELKIGKINGGKLSEI